MWIIKPLEAVSIMSLMALLIGILILFITKEDDNNDV